MHTRMTALALVFIAAVTAHAAPAYREVAEVMLDCDYLTNQTLSVHGIVDRLEKDGLSSTTFILVLQDGLRCRVSRSAFKAPGDQKRKVLFKTIGANDLHVEINQKELLGQGTDVIVRGTLKKEFSKWVLDKSVIRGCGDPDARSALNVQCMGPCAENSWEQRSCPVCSGTGR